MPMTAAIAPTFAARYPEASIIFDNLHAMHDVVSDILANNEKVPRNRKRAAILEAASRYRDSTSFPMSIAEWKSMGDMMGVDNMGGPAVGFLAAWPKATLPRGITMAEAMKAMGHGAPGATPAMPDMPQQKDSTHSGMQHDMKDMDMPKAAKPDTASKSSAEPTAPKKPPTKTPARTKTAPPKKAPTDHSKMPGMKMPDVNAPL